MPVRIVQPRERVKAADHNELAEAVNGLALSGGADEVVDSRGRSSRRAPAPQQWSAGVIVATGPNGEDDFKDDRYWVALGAVKNAAADAADARVEFEEYPTGSPRRRVVAATNKGESLSRGHSLPVGAEVLVFSEHGKGGSRRPRYVFSAVRSPITVRITAFSTITGRANAWSYAWVEVEPGRHGQYNDKTGGRTSLTTEIPAYNIIEANNSASGIQGNSVDMSAVPAGTQFLPVRGNPIVAAWFVTNCDGDRELHFQYENAVSDECAAT